MLSEIVWFPSSFDGNYAPFDAHKYLRSAVTKFLFHSDDHQWSKAVFGASSSSPTSDHCEKGVQEYATERARGGGETSEKTEVEGMDRGLSTFSPLAPLVRTLGGPNERLCHFYALGLALIHRTRSSSDAFS